MTDWWTANRVPAAGCCRCAGGRESAPGPASRRAHAPPSFLNTCRYSWKMYRRYQVEPSPITDPFHRPPFHMNVRNRSATAADTKQGEDGAHKSVKWRRLRWGPECRGEFHADTGLQ